VGRFHGALEAKNAREWFEKVFLKRDPRRYKRIPFYCNDKLIDIIKSSDLPIPILRQEDFVYLEQ